MKDIYVIYLIKAKDTEQYKIGFSKRDNITSRVQALQIGNANALEVLFTFESKHGKKLEKTLHRLYAAKMVHSEWFQLTDEDVNSFLLNCAQIDKNLTLTS